MSAKKRYLAIVLSVIALDLSYSQWVDPPPRYDCPDRPIFPCNCTKGSDEGVYVDCTNTNLASLAVGLKQIKTLVSKVNYYGQIILEMLSFFAFVADSYVNHI
jgi:hypothetical protein